jgi:hypothetical protein
MGVAGNVLHLPAQAALWAGNGAGFPSGYDDRSARASLYSSTLRTL